MSTEIRVASFNASLNRSEAGQLVEDLSTPDDPQAQAVAEIVQRIDADVILINEFDFDAEGEAADLFRLNYLQIGQNGADPVEYPFVYVAPSNTGLQSGFDLDNDGEIGGPNDAWGFGLFEGQFAFAVFSKYEIDTENIRSFQEFRWADMPGALLFDDTGRPLYDPEAPFDPETPDDPATSYYTEEEALARRLSAKNHVDLPVIVEGETVHILAAHPTPPVFDGIEDRNGKLNHDEIRFWTDYVAGARYIYDDQGREGGLAPGERFVILGDYNADPFDGDSVPGAADQFFESPLILGSATDPAITPASVGGREQSALQGGLNATSEGDPAFDTADFGPDTTVPNLRVDYALPSVAGFEYLDGGVFWPGTTDPLFELTGTFPFPSSDHRAVYVDLAITDQGTPADPDRVDVAGLDFAGIAEIASGTEVDGTVLGGLSGLVYDPARGIYLAVSDDRGSEGEDGAVLSSPRLYEIAIDTAGETLSEADIEVLRAIELTTVDGDPLLGLSPDLEGIALAANGNLLLSSERDLNGDPAIYEATAEGVLLAAAPVDAKFLPNAQGTRGVLDNLGFESLTISPDGATLYTATEGGLAQDGGRATLDAPAFARVVQYDLTTGTAAAEYVYPVDPIAVPPEPAGAYADSGLVELLALDNQGTLIALERSFSIGAEDRGYTGKLYLTTTQGATDVSGVAALPRAEEDGEVEALVDEVLQKELLVDLAEFDIAVDNVEGLALGPVNADGTVPLMVVSDDNFSAFGPQATQFLRIDLSLEEFPTLAAALETPSELRYPGPEPIVIAHRGQSADRPEHTLAAYELAIESGADFIEPDLVTTADGHLIARHEPFLATVETDAEGNIVFDADGAPIVTFATTDVAEHAQFADRLTVKELIPGFQTVAGWFAEDFTLAEIKELRAVEDQPDLRPQSAAFDGQFEIPTLEEIVALVQEIEDETGREIGLYPETKEPNFFADFGRFQNEDANGDGALDDGEDLNGNGRLDQVNGGALIDLDTSQILVDTLVETGFTDPERVFIQSFAVENLIRLEDEILPAAGIDLPLVQLTSGNLALPTVDIAYNFGLLGLEGGDPSVYAPLGDLVGPETTYADLVSPAGLAAIAEAYAEGVGPSLSTIFTEEGGTAPLVSDAQAAGLLVHAYTHRDEEEIPGPDGAPLSPEAYFAAILETGVDGVFTDNPDTGRSAVDAVWGAEGPDPDDPAIWLNPEDPGQSLVVTAMKEGGLRSYDLEGRELFRLEPDGIRYNNVDIAYDVPIGGAPTDLAVVSDRANDTLAFFEIAADGTLTDVTSETANLDTIFGVDDGEATAYGLATYKSLEDGTHYAFVTQADGNLIAQLELFAAPDGAAAARVVRTLELPVEEGAEPADYQSEGIAVDRELGRVYVSVEEEIGLVAFEAEPDAGDEIEVIAPIDAPYFAPDLEGVAILYGEDGEGSILVSSQGNASFVAFDRLTGEYQGRAFLGAGAVDGVQESDGLDILTTPLGAAFPSGLLVTQDGNNEPQAVFGDPEDGEIQNFDVNFKYTDLSVLVEALGLAAPDAEFDPRAVEPGLRLEEEASLELGTGGTLRAETVTVEAASGAAALGVEGPGFALAPAEGGAATRLLSLDTLVFSDGTATLRETASFAAMAVGYDIAFGRLYDLPGAGFWGALIEAGTIDVETFADALLASTEFALLNGEALEDAVLLDLLLGNFDGDVTAAERAQYLAELESGAASRAEVLADLIAAGQAEADYEALFGEGVLAFA